MKKLRIINNRILKYIWIVLVICIFVATKQQVQAADLSCIINNSNITISPDGEAFTTDYLIQEYQPLPKGYTVNMNQESALTELQLGEHYYEGVREQDVKIGKWVVHWPIGQCIHEEGVAENYHGMPNANRICYGSYSPGWLGYCADCGELLHNMYFYMSENTAKTLKVLPASGTYFYTCPWCISLEQGASYQHTCKFISVNKYKVKYDTNNPNQSIVTGTMKDTLHMYDNASEYEGEKSSLIYYTDKQLRKNVYSCFGYEFLGWNTNADGSGTMFSDEASVINLTSEENGVVILYAMWDESSSILHINPAGGVYLGKSDVYSVEQDYLTSYKIEMDSLIAPSGYTICFDTNGGEKIANITTKKSFNSWNYDSELAGKLQNNIYYFLGSNQQNDYTYATYFDQAFQLPKPQKSGMAFSGWYLDSELTKLYGKSQEYKISTKDLTVYAKWSPLLLEAEANYTAHDKVGAVDLVWKQEGETANFYKLFQSADLNTWKKIETIVPMDDSTQNVIEFGVESKEREYIIASSGFYEIKLEGATGGDFGRNSGGLGGGVVATVWLEAQDEILFEIGEKPQNNAGGGATAVYVLRGTEKILLAGAGGGGGANTLYSGGDGGTQHPERTQEIGSGGGGEGFPSGQSGKYIPGTTNLIEISDSSLSVYGRYAGMAFGIPGYPIYTYEIFANELINGKWYMRLKRTTGENIYFYWDNKTDFADLTSTNVGTASYSNGILTYYYTTHNSSYGIHGSGYHSMKGNICNGILNFYTKQEIPGTYARSEGGSNYLNYNFVLKDVKNSVGTNSGNGYASITWVDTGYTIDQSRDGVLAKDSKAPDSIVHYWFEVRTSSGMKLYWDEPKDQGNVYYHKAESYNYLGGVAIKVSDSNITTNEIVTGVRGYYYKIDQNEYTKVTEQDIFIKERELIIPSVHDGNYVHIAAVDVAGNLGTEIHIKIPVEDSDEVIKTYEPSPLYTKQLKINTDDGGIYQVGTNEFYVRADGISEYELVLQGYCSGEMHVNYQMDKLYYQFQDNATTMIQVPKAITLGEESIIYDNASLNRYENFNTLIGLKTSYASAIRNDYMSAIEGRTGIIFDSVLDSKVISVYPVVSAEYDEATYTSNIQEDLLHGMNIYPDALPPTIMGIELLEDIEVMELTEDGIDVEISATDSGSGLKELAIKIENKDNGLEEIFSTTQGQIQINITKELALFLGEIEISFIAVDQVGNITSSQGAGFAFSLTSEVVREREPINGDFKEGDGAILKIETKGYVDRVRVEFPSELLEKNSGLNQVYEYEYPYLIKGEEFYFNIPLEIEQKQYEIIVTAYKADEVLYSRPTLMVVEGTVLDELRTRVRDY